MALLSSALNCIVRSRALAFATAATVGVAIACNVAIFSFYNSNLLRPLPFARTDRLVLCDLLDESGSTLSFSERESHAAQQLSQVFDQIAFYYTDVATLVRASGPEQIFCAAVSSAFFETLQPKTVIGRLPSSNDSSGNVAVLSYAAWRDRFYLRKDIIGLPLSISGTSYVVIGVTSDDVQFPRWVDVWLRDQRDIPAEAFGAVPPEKLPPNSRYLRMLGRLRNHYNPAQAVSRINAILPYRENGLSLQVRVSVVALDDVYLGPVKKGLLFLLFCGSAVFLVACSNLAGLATAFALARRSQIAVKYALGLSRSRRRFEIGLESLFFVAPGLLLGCLLGSAMVRGFALISPVSLPRLDNAQFDIRVLGYSLVLGAIMVLVFAFPSSLCGPSAVHLDDLKEQSRGNSRGNGRRGAVLILFQVALSTSLLVVTLLLGKSYRSLSHASLGVDVEKVSVARVALSDPAWNSPEKRQAVYRSLVESLSHAHNVESVGISYDLPLNGAWLSGMVRPGGSDRPLASPCKLHVVDSGFFRTVGMSCLRGRLFDLTDNRKSPAAAIVSRRAAEILFGAADPIGRTISAGFGGDLQPYQIVGLVNDVRFDGAESPVNTDVYLSYLQDPSDSFWVLCKTDIRGTRFEAMVREAIGTAELPISGTSTMQQLSTRLGHSRRFGLVLMAFFAAIAIIQCTLGIYALVSYIVVQRRKEFGLRMALGATPLNVINCAVRAPLLCTAAGLVAGALLGLFCAVILRSYLYNTSYLDPVSFALPPLVLGLLAATAAWIPAKSAVRSEIGYLLRQ